jgi:hypothetical protein
VSVGEADRRPNDRLDSLRREAASCRACPLWRNATQTVFGEEPEIKLVERPRAMVHDDLVHAPLLDDRAIIASDGRQQLVSVAANGLQPKRNGESHARFCRKRM